MHKIISILQLAVLMHFAEEYIIGFPKWATEYFGTTSNNWYIISHIALLIPYSLILIGTYKKRAWGVFLSTGMQALIFTNGIFHIVSTIMQRNYSPGLFSQLLLMPISLFIIFKVRQQRLLTIQNTLYAIISGIIISGLIILSLFLEIPI
jgi:hypothetical protein